jgi:hypothetical protein
MVGAALLQLERNGALVRAHAEVLSKRLDTADIVRDAILQQWHVALPVTNDRTSRCDSVH